MRRKNTHLAAIYHLPSWQGGDRIVPRCQRSLAGYGADPEWSCTDHLDEVTCERCRMLRTHGYAQESRP